MTPSNWRRSSAVWVGPLARVLEKADCSTPTRINPGSEHAADGSNYSPIKYSLVVNMNKKWRRRVCLRGCRAPVHHHRSRSAAPPAISPASSFQGPGGRNLWTVFSLWIPVCVKVLLGHQGTVVFWRQTQIQIELWEKRRPAEALRGRVQLGHALVGQAGREPEVTAPDIKGLIHCWKWQEVRNLCNLFSCQEKKHFFRCFRFKDWL